MSVKVYVEGGGKGKALKAACRKGFRKLIEKLGLAGTMPGIVACGSRNDAYDRFQTALTDGKDIVFLLVDAEGSVAAPAAAAKPWQYLKDRDNWNRPENATDDQCHLMVQLMESWFIADAEALESYFGQGFRKRALPNGLNVESVPKQEVMKGLEQATRAQNCQDYKKGKHSFEILALLDPAKVRKQSPYADRFFEELQRISQR